MRRPARFLPVAAALVVLMLAACGAGDPAGSDPAATTGAPAGAPTTGEDGDAGSGDAGSGDAENVPESLAFTATTVAGEPFDAATLAGEPVVLWFWAPWCPICRGQAPDVREASEQVTVVGVGGLDEASAMQGFVDDTGTGSFTHLSDPDGQVWQKFGVTSQYTFVLIDGSGEVVYTGALSGSELQDRVADLTA